LNQIQSEIQFSERLNQIQKQILQVNQHKLNFLDKQSDYYLNIIYDNNQDKMKFLNNQIESKISEIKSINEQLMDNENKLDYLKSAKSKLLEIKDRESNLDFNNIDIENKIKNKLIIKNQDNYYSEILENKRFIEIIKIQKELEFIKNDLNLAIDNQIKDLKNIMLDEKSNQNIISVVGWDKDIINIKDSSIIDIKDKDIIDIEDKDIINIEDKDIINIEDSSSLVVGGDIIDNNKQAIKFSQNLNIDKWVNSQNNYNF